MNSIIKKVPDNLKYKAKYYLKYLPLALSILFLVISIMFTQNTVHKQRTIEQNLRAIKNRLSNAELQMAVYEQHYPEYKDMIRKGLVGDSQRLNWLETLQAIGNEYNIPNIDFTLDSAEETDETHPLFEGSLSQLYTTHMELKLKMKHEGDFYRLITELRERTKGLFSVEQCQLQKETDESGAPTSLNGSCELEWYGLHDVTAQEDESWEQNSCRIS